MRYFLITWNPDNKLAFGMVLIQDEDFPSYNDILSEVRTYNEDIKSIVIINIFEFKNKYDYLAYTDQQ